MLSTNPLQRIVRNTPELPNHEAGAGRKRGVGGGRAGGRLSALTPPTGNLPPSHANPSSSSIPEGSTAAGHATATMEQLDMAWEDKKSDLKEAKKTIEASEADLGRFREQHAAEMQAITERQQQAGKGYKPTRASRRGGSNGNLTSQSMPNLGR